MAVTSHRCQAVNLVGCAGLTKSVRFSIGKIRLLYQKHQVPSSCLLYAFEMMKDALRNL